MYCDRSGRANGRGLSPPSTDLRLGTMDGGSRASSRDEAFSLGVENSLPFLSQGASSPHVPQGFGYQQPPHWLVSPAAPPSYFPQLGQCSSDFIDLLYVCMYIFIYFL